MFVCSAEFIENVNNQTRNSELNPRKKFGKRKMKRARIFLIILRSMEFNYINHYIIINRSIHFNSINNRNLLILIQFISFHFISQINHFKSILLLFFSSP